MSEANISLTRRYIDEVVNQGKFDVIDEIYAEDYVNHTTTSGGEIKGRQGVRDIVEQWRAAFPDVRVSLDDEFAADDRVVTRITVTGTHEGDWRGVAPTGASVDIRIISIFRIEDGQIIERWENADMLGLVQQLGIA